MEMVSQNKKVHKGNLLSLPLLKQTLKSTWVLWLVMTIGCSAIFLIINTVVFSKDIFVNIDMDKVSVYVTDENLSWLQILGLLDKMGYSLERIQVMSRIDLNSILNELVYKIAGVLLPMIYVMISANQLLAKQVTSGSLAYVLSTPTSRKTVLRTYALFMAASIVAMYVIVTSSALGSEAIAGAIRLSNGGARNMIPLRTFLYCLSSMCAMLCLAGICFGASAWFNKSSYSTAVGGGICVISFLGVILGLFGNKVFVSVGIGVEAMSIFNYFSIFTLIDTESISSHIKYLYHLSDGAQSLAWLFKMIGLLAVGALFAIIGSVKFIKKDLPL